MSARYTRFQRARGSLVPTLPELYRIKEPRGSLPILNKTIDDVHNNQLFTPEPGRPMNEMHENPARLRSLEGSPVPPIHANNIVQRDASNGSYELAVADNSSVERSVSKESIIFKVTSKRSKKLIIPQKSDNSPRRRRDKSLPRERPSIPHLMLSDQKKVLANADT